MSPTAPAKNGAVSGYRVGGKTGTSQKLDSSDPAARIASYVAVAPIDDPQIAVLVCLDEPHSWTTSGGALSGPVCAQVLAQVLPYLGIEPDYTAEEQEKTVCRRARCDRLAHGRRAPETGRIWL